MTTKKKIKDLLTGIVRETEQSVGGKHEPENNAVKIIENGKGVRKIHISEVRKSKAWEIRDDLTEWKNNDFALYLISIVRKSVFSNWDANRIGVTLYLGRIRDKLSQTLGFCDNIVLKDYMDFFVEHWGSYYFRQNGDFYMGSMREDEPIKDFGTKYNYQSSFGRFLSKSDKDSILERKKISSGDLEPSFLSGGENFILDFGLLLPLNWLVKIKKYSSTKAVEYVASAFKNIYNKGNWKMVIKTTEEFCPYPDWFVIKDCNDVLTKVGAKVEVKLKFSKNNSWCVF